VILRFLLLFIAAHACFAQLTGIVSNNFVAPADWSWWVGNGSLSETVNGLTSASNGSLVYAGSVPSPHYELRAKYRIASSGGSYVTYLRATTNANLHANTGSFYAAELTNLSVIGGNCTGTLKLWRRDAGTFDLIGVLRDGYRVRD